MSRWKRGSSGVGQKAATNIFGKYPNYQDMARLEYGRLLWKSASSRWRLLAHWGNPEHPYAERFRQRRLIVERILESGLSDEQLKSEEHSLRAVVPEISPIFGSI